MKRFVGILDEYLEDALSVLLYAYLVAIVFAEVIARYVFKSSMLWSNETAIYAFIWLCYLSMAVMAKSRSHLAVTFVRDAMPRAVQFALLMLSDALLIALSTVIAVYIYQPLGDVIEFGEKMVGANLPLWIAMAAVPVGWTLVAIRTVQRALVSYRAWREGRPLSSATAFAD